MDFRILFATCVALTAMCRVSQAQVDASLLRPGVDSLAIYSVEDADTVRHGTLQQELRIQQADDQRRVLLASERRTDRGRSLEYTLILDFDGLRPIGESGDWYSIQYAGGRAVGWVRRSEGDTIAVDASLPAGTISAESFEWVLRASDLHEGASFEMLGFFPTVFLMSSETRPPAFVPLQALVTGVEDVNGTPCWVVELRRGPSHGLMRTIWIDQQTRQLRQRVVPLETHLEWLYTAPLQREREMERERLAREQADRAVQTAISTKWRPVLQDVLTTLGELVRAHNREAGTAFQVDLPPLPANRYARDGAPYSGTVTFDDSTYWRVGVTHTARADEGDRPGLVLWLRTRGRTGPEDYVTFGSLPVEDQLLVRVRARTPDAPTSFLPRTIALPDYQEGLAAVLQRLLEWQLQLLEAKPPDYILRVTSTVTCYHRAGGRR